MKKTTLRHQNPDGSTSTRQTANPYTHVTLIEGKAATWHSRRDLAEKQVNSWIASGRKYGFEPKPGDYAVEQINHGSRNQTKEVTMKKAESNVRHASRVEAEKASGRKVYTCTVCGNRHRAPKMKYAAGRIVNRCRQCDTNLRTERRRTAAEEKKAA